MEEVPCRYAKVFFGGEQLAQFAVFGAATADERDQSSVLALAKKIAEQFCCFFSAPIFKTTKSRYVYTLEVYRLAEVERCECLVRDLPSARFIHDAESGAVEIPGEILRFVDVQAQDIVFVKLPRDNVCCLALAASEDENHGGNSAVV